MLYDFIIIGGGIVGVSTAMHLCEHRPGAGILVLEKEAGLAHHQTGHNSGVIHAGIYYAPGSFKAELCRRGAIATKAFCAANAIPYEVPGKLVVATDAEEMARMDALYERAVANNVEVERIDAAELSRREPAIRGLGALLVPSTGIVSYREVTAAMGREVTAAGGTIRFGEKVVGLTETPDAVVVTTDKGEYRAARLVACAGLQADRIARLGAVPISCRILPFRGEYFRLPPARDALISHLIYPVPDPALPFLGIHLTRMIDGSVSVGPNAVLGMAREGYGKFAVDLRDLASTLTYTGFWGTLARYPGAALSEIAHSLSRARYLEACRKYCPELSLDDLLPMEAGIRAQAVLADGTLVHDFLFAETARMLHVLNAPSPAATSAIPIGALIADKVVGVERPLASV